MTYSADEQKMTPDEIKALVPTSPDAIPVGLALVHTEMGGGYGSLDIFTDARGNLFIACVNSLFNNNNVTWIDLFVTPAGQGISQGAQYRFIPQNKLDKAAFCDSGNDLIMVGESHSLNFPPGQPRPINFEMGRINGIWNSSPEWLANRGGEGVIIVPTDPIPAPEVDYTKIQQIVEAVVGATEANSLVKQITTGNVSVRTAVREIDKQALVYLMDPANYNDTHDPTHLAKQFQDNFFQSVKNAAANPLANVLGGQDAWGQARKAELTKIVHDGSHQP